MAMTHIDTGIQDTEPIRFLEPLGLGDEELASYTIRLNGSKPEWGNLLDTYYSSYDDLMRWIFTKKWPDTEAVGKINTGKVLRFIQLRPEDSTQWLFVGAYDILDEYTEEDGTILYHYREIPRYAPLKARAVRDGLHVFDRLRERYGLPSDDIDGWDPTPGDAFDTQRARSA